MPAEFTPRPSTGRIVHLATRVGLSDVRPDSRIRLDALARHLQEVSDADSSSAGVEDGYWVMRRLALRIRRTPRMRAALDLSTWCSGAGPRWAERRTDVTVGGEVCVEAAAIWVHIDPATGGPSPLPTSFAAIWGETAGTRKVSARLEHGAPPPGCARRPWPLRAVDFDALHHMNNAAYWEPVEDELARRPGLRVTRAEVEFRGGIDPGDDVEMAVAERPDGFAMWLCVGGDVRGSALIGSAS